MPNLFPTQQLESTPDPLLSRDKTAVRFGRSFKFDFEAGEFVLTPNGKVTETQDVEAWLEWCSKALRTARYKYLVYSRNYGQEYEELIGKGLTRAAIESEIKRITEETLKVDPRTAGVKNFTFTWDNGAVYFTCEVSNVRGEIGQISGSVVIG